MSYAIKKAGIPFKLKLDTNADLTGQAAGFSAYYIEDLTGTKTVVSNAFVEDANTAGLYMVDITIPTAGDYTLVINNSGIGMDNHAAPLVVVNATIDDVKAVVDTLTTTMNTVAADVVNLDGASLSTIQTNIQNVVSLIDDPTKTVAVTVSGDETALLATGAVISNKAAGAGTFTGTVDSSTFDGTNTIVNFSNVDATVGLGDLVVGDVLSDGTVDTTGTVVTIDSLLSPVNSVLEFINKINADLTTGASSLSVLSGYTDDIENMINGTKFLNDGVTANPFYDATNPGVAKESSLTSGLTNIQTALETSLTDAQAAIQADIAAVKTVVDANATVLTDAGFGLAALKTLIDTASTTNATNTTNVLALLNDSTNGLSAINANLTTRFDSVDTAVASLQTKADGLSAPQSFKLFA